MVPGSRYKTPAPLLRAFPAPDYLTMPAVGIDISDYAIKHMLIKRRGRHFHLEQVGKVDLPLGVIEGGEIKDEETVVKLLTRIRDEHDYSHAHISLPEAHAYLFQLELPTDSSADTEQLVEFHLKEHVPLGPDEAVYDYNVYESRERDFVVNVSVYPAKIAEHYAQLVEQAGYTVLSSEIEGHATARALLLHAHSEPTIIVDIGRSEASFSISVNGTVTFTASLDIGGDQFTRAIARGMDVSFQEAEHLKHTHGFRDLPESALVYQALAPHMQEFKEAINRHFIYWQMHASVGDVNDVSRIILVGGNANMPGLPEFLSAMLEVRVEVGNVWTNIFSFNEYLPNLHRKASLEFATAAGLAMRSLLRSSA